MEESRYSIVDMEGFLMAPTQQYHGLIQSILSHISYMNKTSIKSSAIYFSFTCIVTMATARNFAYFLDIPSQDVFQFKILSCP